MKAHGIMTRVSRLEDRIRPEGPKVVILFGDDPVPDDVTKKTQVLRFDEEDRGL